MIDRNAQYAVSKNGFLPASPVPPLTNVYYERWESLASRLSQRLAQSTFCADIASLPILLTTHLNTEAEHQRAHVLLTFIAHAFVWGSSKPREILPPQIAVPYTEVSAHLGLPPSATATSLIAWNWMPIELEADITIPENIKCPITFTGTSDEEWFYAISVAIEAKGGHVIPTMQHCAVAAASSDSVVVADCLQAFCKQVSEVTALLQRMNERCSPDVFYNRIRPFLAGGKGMEHVGLPDGVFFSSERQRGTWTKHSGATNAQSALIQFLDIALGVKHGEQKGGSNVLLEMREYMRPEHKAFLEDFDRLSKIREYAISGENREVRRAYADAVNALMHFRDVHIKIVTRYIIVPSRKAKSRMVEDVKQANGPVEGQEDLKGTGGTDLMAFLRQTRDDTKAVLD